MFSEIRDDETRKLVGALLVSMSIASAVVVMFVTWFVNKYISSQTVTNTYIAGDGASTAQVAALEETVSRQQYAVNKLETRILDLEGAIRDLKVRLHEPQVPVTYQAMTPTHSTNRLRYAADSFHN